MEPLALIVAMTRERVIGREGGMPWHLPEDLKHFRAITTGHAILMGRKTYEEVLGFGVEWPYGDCRTFVVTSDENYQVSTPNTEVLARIDEKAIERIRSASQKNVWIVGGGQVITRFLDLGAIDEMILCLIPIVLGKGIRLFPGEPLETRFDLVSAESYRSGAVMLTYAKK